MRRIAGYIKFIDIEAAIWLAGLIILASLSFDDGTHFSLCPFHNIGIDFCPGCGLGKSISLLLHGDFAASVETHYLGIFAFLVLSYRIIALTKNRIDKNKYHTEIIRKNNG